MVFGRHKMSEEAQRRHADDKELAPRYQELLTAAGAAERELREAQAGRSAYSDTQRFYAELDAALEGARQAAEANARLTMGPATYDDRIARRKARVRDDVFRWTSAAERMRTLHDAYRLEAMGRSGTLVPASRPVEGYASSAPQIAGLDSGGPAELAQESDDAHVGIDLRRSISQTRP